MRRTGGIGPLCRRPHAPRSNEKHRPEAVFRAAGGLGGHDDASVRDAGSATVQLRAIAIRRSMRSSVDGWVLNNPLRPPPDSGFMIIICAVSG